MQNFFMMVQKGRPSKNQQLEIQNRLRPYFEKCMSAGFAARETEANIKTVTKYYKIWSEEIAKATDADFVSRVRQEREQIILGYDKLIFELYETLDIINSEISFFKKNSKEIPKSLFDKKLGIIKEISSLFKMVA
jgi:hypothetical protein